jgi:3-phosphoshikimate 1-carboxyvinyltransferase
MELTVEYKKPIKSVINIPGDKSISHRSVIIGSIASGVTDIENFLPGQDCLSTVSCMRQLGINIEQISSTHLRITGKGASLSEPENVLDVGNSGTTIRLLSGVLAGQGFFSVISGDVSIRMRPMQRVVNPLREMGANIEGRCESRFAPLAIKGGGLKGINYQSPVASAQVKSAVLLAGVYADKETSVTEPALSRDHTERMLKGFGADIKTDGLTTIIKPGKLTAQKIIVPGDISSAAFYLVAGAIIPGSKVTVPQVGLNPTRTGIIEVLKQMGARIIISNQVESSGEPIGDITVEGNTELKGIVIGGGLIPRLIDEIPVLAVAGAAAQGKTVIKDAAELKIKESNRLRAIANELARFGVDIQDTDDGLIINGGRKYTGSVCESYYDHRIAMACALMGLIASGKTVVRDAECIDISFPGFKEILVNSI